MDLFTHFLLPYLVANLFGLNRRLTAALVMGAVAPDLDIALVWINYIYPTSALIVHRGLTHTLFFGFLTAFAVLTIACSRKVQGFLSRFVNYEVDLSLVSISLAYAGLVLHLLLDFLTSKGVPLLYPWSRLRFSAEIFFYTEPVLIAASLIVLWILIRKRKNPVPPNRRYFIILFAVILTVLIAAGAARLGGKEAATEFSYDNSSFVYPDSGLFKWVILKEDRDMFHVMEFNYLNRSKEQVLIIPRLSTNARLNESCKALQMARDLPEVNLFRWRSYAVAINVSKKDDTYLIEYFDPVVSIRRSDGWPGSFMRNMGRLQVRVIGMNASVVS